MIEISKKDDINHKNNNVFRIFILLFITIKIKLMGIKQDSEINSMPAINLLLI